MREDRGAYATLEGETRSRAKRLQLSRWTSVCAAGLLLALAAALTACKDVDIGAAYTPQGLAFTDTDSGPTLGGTVTITPPLIVRDIDAYRLYFGGETLANARLAEIGSAAPAAAPAVIIDDHTEIPSGATHFWVFPVVNGAELEYAAALAISNYIHVPVPMLFSLAPDRGMQGSTFEVTLSGADFDSGATVTVSGSGIEVDDVTVVSASEITARFAIATETALSELGVTVTTAGGSSIAQTFTVCDEGDEDCGVLDGGWAYENLRADSGECEAPVGPSPDGPLTGRVAYVLDISRSMATSFTVDGQPFSRNSLLRQVWFDEVTRLVGTPSFFNVILFNETHELWKSTLQFASAQNVKTAKDWYDSPVSEQPRRDLAPGGNTNGVYGALEQAFKQSGVETIVFVSDGFPNGPGNDPLGIIDTSITEWNPTSRITLHTVGLMLGGNEDKTPAESFMKSLAEANGGCFVRYEADPVAP